MAKKSKRDKNIAYNIEKQINWQVSQDKKKKKRNIIVIIIVSVVVLAFVVTLALAAMNIADKNKSNTPASDTSTSEDKDKTDTSKDTSAHNTPANDGITTDDGLPKVTFADDSVKTPSIEMPSNFKTPTELETKVLEQGTGAEIKATDTISAFYSGWTVDKNQFDSSYARGSATSFSLSSVIKGWTQGLTGKHVGDTVELVIPSDLGYGATGSGDTIPANAPLIFVVKIESVK
ncbi:MAG: FKBP-type peptidyl-prolyl cis-trans isomerase [Candidatus Ancillula sp.]|jgi:peptidylprolyl isomerase|nr:FKBP-type peptidyl-prolyl cis-trans isomerase [Candidatus Ancillula sp.]